MPIVDPTKQDTDIWIEDLTKGTLSRLTFGSFNEINAAAGFKVNVFGRLLVDLNVLVRLNNEGLRDKISPLVGLEYAF